MPNTTSTPTFSMARTRACAPVTLTGAVTACAAGCWAAGAAGADAAAGCAGAAGLGALLGGCCAAVLAGMSSGDGACALGGTGLVCSVIGWLPWSRCHDVRGLGIKKPLVPGGSRGARAESSWVSSLRPSQLRGGGSASRLHPHPQACLTSNYHWLGLII